MISSTMYDKKVTKRSTNDVGAAVVAPALDELDPVIIVVVIGITEIATSIFTNRIVALELATANNVPMKHFEMNNNF
jgi:hypothetical protein